MVGGWESGDVWLVNDEWVGEGACISNPPTTLAIRTILDFFDTCSTLEINY